MMTRSMIHSAIIPVVLFLLGPLHAGAQGGGDAPLERGRAMTDWFHEGDLTSIVAAFTTEMREAIGHEEGLGAFRDQVQESMGREIEVIGERVYEAGPFEVYERRARYEHAPSDLLVVWSFDAEGRVAGFQITAPESQVEAESPHEAYRTRATLRLPFEGEWTVFWGGRDIEQNYHAAHADQRFAYDFVVEIDGRRRLGAGLDNGDYHCFGRPILAPAPGEVLHAVDGIVDNVPGEMNPSNPAGNHVVLDLGDEEYAFLAHFREGSVRVRAGDRVAAGDTLGVCGNSGNSSEPHLHFHLQDTPHGGAGQGLPASFVDYTADDRRVERGEPVKGERVRDDG